MIGVPHQANGSEQLNDIAAEIRLPPEHAVTCCAGEGVMIVLKAFSECKHRNKIVIRAVIVEVEAARSEVVADRANAPTRLIDDETANQAAPQEPERSARPGTRQDSSDDCRNRYMVSTFQLLIGTARHEDPRDKRRVQQLKLCRPGLSGREAERKVLCGFRK